MLIETWLAHQRRDAYWKHGSVAYDYGALKATVLSVGGWSNNYRNNMDHFVRHLSAHVKAIAETSWTQTFGRADWQMRTDSYLKLTATNFSIYVSIRLYDGQDLFQERHWQSQWQRDFM